MISPLQAQIQPGIPQEIPVVPAPGPDIGSNPQAEPEISPPSPDRITPPGPDGPEPIPDPSSPEITPPPEHMQRVLH